MKKYKNHTLQEYVDVLSKKTPVPGGGSAAALAAGLGVGLISMVARYSVKEGMKKTSEKRIKSIISQCQKIKKELVKLVDLDAEAYLKVIKAKGGSKVVKKASLKNAAKVPKDVAKLCYKAILLTPYLVEHGNRYLMSDVEVAVEMLQAAYNSAMVLARQEQP